MNQEELDEYFDYDTILNRMLDRIPNTLDKREGSIIYDALAPDAAEIAQMYITLKNNIDLIFVDTSVAEYLDRLSNQIGLTREAATKAIKQASFYDAENHLMDIEIGQRFTIDDLVFKAIEKIETGKFKMECETAGVIGNGVAGNLIPVDYIQNLARAELTDVLIPGEDEESDDSLRARYFDTINEKAFAGNIADYKKKTKEIQGVGAVKVTPIFNGGGTVKLTILDSDFNKASSVLVEKVQNEICPQKSNLGIGLAPIGHQVTVDTATEHEINVSATLTLTEGSELELVKPEVERQIKNYLLDLRKNWEDEQNLIVRISQVESRILNIETVLDISNVTINSDTSNIELTEMEIPILKEVTLS